MMQFAFNNKDGKSFTQFIRDLPTSEKRALEGCVSAAQDAIAAGMGTAVASLTEGFTRSIQGQSVGRDSRDSRDSGDPLVFSAVPVAEAVPVTAEAVISSVQDTPLNALVTTLVANGDIGKLKEMKDATLQAVRDATQRAEIGRFFDAKIAEASKAVKPSAPPKYGS